MGSAKDNGAVWAIAQNERATVSSLDAVKSSLQTGQSIIDVANSAGTTVSNLLTQLQQKALAASDTSLDSNSRARSTTTSSRSATRSRRRSRTPTSTALT